MVDCSEFIVEAMKYIDEKIETLNPKSIDRNRLHSKVKAQIIANIKRIASLKQSDAYKEIDNIFNAKLLEELSKNYELQFLKI